MNIDSPANLTIKIVHHIDVLEKSEVKFAHTEWATFFALTVDGIAIGIGNSDIEEKRGRLISWLILKGQVNSIVCGPLNSIGLFDLK